MKPYWSDGACTLYLGDCQAVLAELPEASVDAMVTDPPAGIAFMGRAWDTDKGGRSEWIAWLTGVMVEAYRVLKPGGHALVWALPRTSHWTATALEDAGFTIRDCVVHLFGSGFPKSLDVGKAIDRAAGVEREVVGPSPHHSPGRTVEWGNGTTYGTQEAQGKWITAPATPDAQRWDGWGTSLKPGAEHWWLVRKPFPGTVAANVLTHGVGAIHVDTCRVEIGADDLDSLRVKDGTVTGLMIERNGIYGTTRRTPHGNPAGRWPTNLVLTHSATCPEGGPCSGDCPVGDLDRQGGQRTSGKMRAGVRRDNRAGWAGPMPETTGAETYGDSGGASRFFPTFRYQAKAPASERPRLDDGTAWPTVKPVALMRWLVRLVTPPGGLVVDPFSGSGTTGEACAAEGFRCILVDRDVTAAELTKVRLSKATQADLFGADVKRTSLT